MKPKHHAAPIEFGFTVHAFSLEIERTQDGARIQRERDQSRADQAEAATKQLELKGTNEHQP